MKSISHTKDKMNKNRYLVVKICCMIIAAYVFTGISMPTAKAEAGIKLYNYSSKTTSNYTGKQVGATLNGVKISIPGTPGILVDGCALLPFTEVFQNSSIAADCVYNEAKGTITISKYDKIIVMTIDSKSAKVNGKTVKMSVAPKKIKYMDVDKIQVLVPSRFVSETLGLGYTWNSNKSTVEIKKKSILLSYNSGDKLEYTGTKGKVTVNGKSVSLGSMPSIIINNTAMLRAKSVFANTKINAIYTYKKADQSVTISKGDKVLVMTIGSKTAYLNGTKLTLSTAPVYVTNHETNASYVMVPGSFTATSLGYSYKWNSTTKTSSISSSNSELGDSGDISEIGTILKDWTASKTQYSKSSGVTEIKSETDTANSTGTISSVSRDYSNVATNSETFMLTSTTPYHNLTSTKSDQTITILAVDQLCNNNTYQMNGNSSNFVNTIDLINNADQKTATIKLAILKNNYQYDIRLSADKLTLYVTVYYNALISATIGTNDEGDFLVLNGVSAFNATITEQSGLLYIDLPDTINSLGDLTTAITGSKYINQIISTSMADKTQLILSLNSGYQYYYKENGSKLAIAFQPKSVVDNNNYEIVIPKPAQVTSDMITNVDHYFSNYFVITLKGDYTSSINRSNITNSSSTVEKISVTCNSSGNTEIKVTTSKLQGYEIVSDNNNIYVNVGNPKDIYKNIVVLDPGHGGKASGAVQKGIYEKNLNFKIMYTLGKKYFNKDTTKLKVYYTRTSDVDMSLKDRAAFAKKVGADLFVSLHMNSAPQAPKACGTEIFYSHNNNSANRAGLTSQKLASMILENLYPAIGSSNRGVKEEIYTVIDRNTVPAVLIELGFLTNNTDYSIITNEEKQKLAMESVYKSLLQVFEKYPTGR